MKKGSIHGDRAHPAVFWLGSAAITAGLAFHLPMFIDAASMNYHLAGMPVDWRMFLGMALIGGGTLAGWYGLLPAAFDAKAVRSPPDASPPPRSTSDRLGAAHWRLMVVLALALMIDAMKPASLAFTIPGMAQEYGLPREIVALLPFVALTGLTVGSYMWGVIGDRIGRRAAILLSGVMFVGTAICGAMPGFIGNLIMCFFMGLAAGGMLPITYTLLAESLPRKRRGAAMVLIGGIGLVGGYFAASGCATLFEPEFGWRIMWFFSAPTGLLLISFSPLIPESSRFLLLRGRFEEFLANARRFGVNAAESLGAPATSTEVDKSADLLRPPFRGPTIALNLVALSWGLINFGLLLWLPAELRRRGFSVAGSDVLLLDSTLLALPTMFVVAFLYDRWSAKATLSMLLVATVLGLLGLSLMDVSIRFIDDHLMWVFWMLIVGVNGIIAVLLPYAAENYPILLRGRGTGLVAGTSKLGGLSAQAVTMAALVPSLGATAVALVLPVAASAALLVRYGAEHPHEG
jgi:putative MFS transporter